MELKIVEAPKRASVKKVVVSPYRKAEIICISGLMVTYLMPNGEMETICSL